MGTVFSGDRVGMNSWTPISAHKLPNGFPMKPPKQFPDENVLLKVHTPGSHKSYHRFHSKYFLKCNNLCSGVETWYFFPQYQKSELHCGH